MKIEVVYEGPLSEWPGPYFPEVNSQVEILQSVLGLSRRAALQYLIMGASAALSYPLLTSTGASAQTQARGLLNATLAGLDVARPVIPPRAVQTALGNIRNSSSEERRGIVVADFSTNGVQTDSGDTIVAVPRQGFVTARVSGSVGAATGAGSTTAHTQLGSRSKAYRVAG